MHERIPRWSILAGLVVALLAAGSCPASGQGDAESLEGRIQAKRRQLALLEGQIGALVNQERDLRDGGLVAVRTGNRVVSIERARLRTSLRQFVVHKAVVEWGITGDYGTIGRLADGRWVEEQASVLEREIVGESDAFLRDLTHSRVEMEAEIRLLREQIEYAEEQLRIRRGGKPLPPGSLMPGGVMGQWAPASRRVCPSPLFGQLLWGASGARCVGAEHTMFPGWRFGENTPLVCAKCTPNCSFAETNGGRLICVVSGAWAPPGPSAGPPPGPRRTPSNPAPAGGREDLSGRKQALGLELDRLRQAGRWNPDHHYQVGTWLGNAVNSLQLDAVETLMHDYAGCYQTANAERERIAAAARAGRYRTPGERIAETDRVGRSFNACIEAARARRLETIRR